MIAMTTGVLDHNADSPVAQKAMPIDLCIIVKLCENN